MLLRTALKFSLAAGFLLSGLFASSLAQQAGAPTAKPASGCCSEKPGCGTACEKCSADCKTACDKGQARGKAVQKVYPVADLVLSPPSAFRCVVENGTFEAESQRAACGKSCLADLLVQLIKKSVAPASWSGVGGAGTVDYFPLGNALVVSQPPDVQEQVAELLAALRRLQDIQVVVETRLLTTSDMAVQKFFRSEEEAKAYNLCFLKPEQVRELLAKAETDPRTQVVCSPKITTFDGQPATICLQDQKKFVVGLSMGRDGQKVVCEPKTEEVACGLNLQVQPTVSADRRFVRLDLNVTNTAVDSVARVPVQPPCAKEGSEVAQCSYQLELPQVRTHQLSKCVCVPDGGSVLIAGWSNKRVGRNEFGPPVLSRIPYVNRLFKNVAYDTAVDTTYVVVTARVIDAGTADGNVAVVPPKALPSAIVSYPDAPKAPCCAQATACQVKTAACCEQCAQGTCEKCVASTTKPCCTACAPAQEGVKHLGKVKELYHEACATGQRDLARKLAQLALDMDPTCFDQTRGSEQKPLPVYFPTKP